MLTVFSNGALVNNETASNNISVYSLFLISFLGIFLIRSAASEYLSVSIHFVWEGLAPLQYIFQHCSVWKQLCLLLVENLVLCQMTYEL